MKKILVLGTGLVGSAMVRDLAIQHQVIAADVDSERLDPLRPVPNVTIFQGNLLDPSLFNEVAKQVDLIIGSLPGNLGFESVKLSIEAGKNMVDISFFPEDAFKLDRLAKHHGVTIVTDCGVAPGMGNMILGFHNSEMRIEQFRCLVGGLPMVREWPWQYKAVFSPIDVIEEYTRIARFVVNGAIVEREALSDPELIDLEPAGTLEAFNSDGLRSLLTTMKIPNMIEKTLRYPGTIDYLRMLRKAGFFRTDPIQVGDILVKPLDVTGQLLFDQWKLKPGEEEFTIMRIDIEGYRGGDKTSVRYDLYDRFDRDSGITSMARTTGYTATAVANLVIDSAFVSPGINPPEFVGAHPALLGYVMNYLKERGVIYRKTDS